MEKKVISNKLNEVDFLKIKKDILGNNQSIIDFSEIDIHSFLPYYVLENNESFLQKNHICDFSEGIFSEKSLIQDWFNLLNREYRDDYNAVVSKGVADSLELISNQDKFKYKKWLIPNDISPIYSHIINKNFIPTAYYSTLEENTCPFYYNIDGDINLTFKEAEVVLLCIPLYPLSISGNKNGCQNLFNLIKNNQDKMFIIDSSNLSHHRNNITDNIVNNSFEDLSYLISLYELGNVYILTSLTKSMMIPNTFGVNLIPKIDIETINLFSSRKLDKKRLETTHLMFNKYRLITEYTSEYLFFLRNNLDNFWQKTYHYSFFKNLDLQNKKLNNITLNEGYLYHINIEPEALLIENILAIPASVFGGNQGSVISILTKREF